MRPIRWSAPLIVGLMFFAGLPTASYAFSGEAMARAVSALIPDAPVMVSVARCESGLRHTDTSGKVLRGGLGSSMIGLFQLHETYHRAPALALGYNIDTLYGNIAYARTLFQAEGTTPWLSSEHCWGTTAPAAPAAQVPTTASLTTGIRFGSVGQEVGVLQRLLSEAGFSVKEEKNNIPHFGVATWQALEKFQCRQRIACFANPSMRKGAGSVDERTRRALEALL